MRRRGMGTRKGNTKNTFTVILVYICVAIVWGLIAFNLPMEFAWRSLLFFGGSPLLTLLVVFIIYKGPDMIAKFRRR